MPVRSHTPMKRRFETQCTEYDWIARCLPSAQNVRVAERSWSARFRRTPFAALARSAITAVARRAGVTQLAECLLPKRTVSRRRRGTPEQRLPTAVRLLFGGLGLAPGRRPAQRSNERNRGAAAAAGATSGAEKALHTREKTGHSRTLLGCEIGVSDAEECQVLSGHSCVNRRFRSRALRAFARPFVREMLAPRRRLTTLRGCPAWGSRSLAAAATVPAPPR